MIYERDVAHNARKLFQYGHEFSQSLPFMTPLT